VRFSIPRASSAVLEVQRVDGSGQQYDKVLDRERRLSGGRRCSDRLRGGSKVCNESGEILKVFEGE
jgi:hypothetical protein